MTPTPPDRICATCGRPFSWRKKWARDWQNVPYCSKACRGGPGALGEALERAIPDLLTKRAAGATICPSEAAKVVDPDGWRDLMEETRRAARRLVHRGKVDLTQKGRVVDPGTLRGPIRNSPGALTPARVSLLRGRDPRGRRRVPRRVHSDRRKEVA